MKKINILRLLVLGALVVALMWPLSTPANNLAECPEALVVFSGDTTLARPLASAHLLEEAEEAVQRTLWHWRKSGRHFAGATLLGLSEDQGQLSIRYRLSRGPLVRVSDVVFYGARRTSEQLLSHLVGIPSGALITPEMLESAIIRLSRQEYLHSAGPARVYRGDDLQQGIVALELSESPLIDFSGALGYEPEADEMVGFVTLRLSNFFGYGRVVSVNVDRRQQNRRESSYQYSQPLGWLTDSRLGGEIAVRDYAEFYQFRSSLSLSTYIGDRFSLRGTFGLSSTSPGSESGPRYNSLKVTLAGEAQSGSAVGLRGMRTSQMTIGWSLQYLTRHGQRDSSDPNSDFSFDERRWSFLVKRSQPLFKLLSLRSSLELAEYVSSDPNPPLAEKYLLGGPGRADILGGSGSLRGYARDRFSATRYALVTLQPEISVNSASFFLFFDAAYIEDEGPGNVVQRPLGYGAGVRLLGSERSLTLELGWGEQFEFDQARISIGLNGR